MSLWLCLRFELLPLEALLQQRGCRHDIATVIASQRKVLVCDDQTSLAGVLPGQSVNTAQALLSHCEHRVLERSLETEDRLLEQLTSWAYGISPHL